MDVYKLSNETGHGSSETRLGQEGAGGILRYICLSRKNKGEI